MLNPVKTADFKKLDSFLSQLIKDQKAPGVVFLLYAKGTIKYLQKFGWQDLENDVPIEFDTIFRIYSMTKPIITVALMMLFEAGKFELNNPISKFIPKFKEMKVFVKEEDGKIITERLEREITILDLFTHTSGLSYGLFEDDPIDKLYNEKLAYEKLKSLSLEKGIQIISNIPLRFQPGKFFRYSFATDVLGRLIEILSGYPLDEFLEKRIFQPLEMTDTFFYVPKEKLNRFIKIYSYDEESKIKLIDSPNVMERFTGNYRFLSGGSGLVSTTKDFFNFSLMFLNKGKFKEKQLLCSETIDLITRNYLENNRTITDQALNRLIVESLLNLNEYGQGLGIRVRIKDSQELGIIGEHGWGGAAHTYYWVDPLNEVIGLFMTQVTFPHPSLDRTSLLPLAYEGLKISQMMNQ
ncbi:MAG: beta-lactamase family protein [Candidatus Heimdallarchaeota archaeon]|nr:MAG: beta-lactamase family protein [Candidatus Heimdallarchaeota archaeon]